MRQIKFNRFLNPNEYPQRIFWDLVRLFDRELSKIGHIFTKQPCLEINEIDNTIKKAVLLIHYMHSDKKTNFRMIKIILDLENWHLKLKIAVFSTALNLKVLQQIKKSFKDSHLDAKIYWILPASIWNSTAVIRLTSTIPMPCTDIDY